MDEVGIDMQVISHGAPSAQKLPAEGAAALVRGVNDRLAAACKAHPTRFAAFAALPSNDPKAAADELERAVMKLKMKGAMMHGLSGGIYGLLLAFGMYFPHRQVMLLFPPIPMRARTFVIVFGALELFLGVTGTAAGVAHFAHLGGMLGGYLMIRYRRGFVR
jgi:membrane associated rhomboid family serine protease